MAQIPPKPPWLTDKESNGGLQVIEGGKAEDSSLMDKATFGLAGHADPNSKNTKQIKLRTEENLTPIMKERRDRFISEYIRDWCGPDAIIRSGGAMTTAVKKFNTYMREPYVQLRLAEIIAAMDEEKLLDNKTILMGLIKEARYQGIGASHGARVTAWKALANIKGLEKTNVNVRGQVDHNVRGGVMLIPVIPGSEEWEKLAEASQKQLKDEVRT